jgi:hypothetical protein
MKHQRLLFACVLGVGLTLALLWLLGGPLAARADPITRYVAMTGNDAANLIPLHF